MKHSREIPLIKRAKDYRLYDGQGTRYLDFFQNNGRALLGHRPGKLSMELKNVLSKGIMFEAPSVYYRRLINAMRKLLPSYPHVRVYEHYLRTEEAVKELGLIRRNEEVPDPLLTEEGGLTICLWRPFLDDNFPFPSVVVPVLPFPGRFAPSLLCFADDPGEKVPESDLCSPLLLAGLTRIVYDLLSFMQDCDREKWNKFDLVIWKRCGPYLIPRCEKEKEYDEMFSTFLENGILLSPRFPGASIIPGECTEGEIKILRKWENGNGSRTDS